MFSISVDHHKKLHMNLYEDKMNNCLEGIHDLFKQNVCNISIIPLDHSEYQEDLRILNEYTACALL